MQAHTFLIPQPPPNPQHPSTIDSFPASDQPISEQTMKSMLISLRHTLYTDLSATVSSLANEVQQHNQHLQNVESKMSKRFTAHNDLIDMCTEHEDDMQLIKLKLADVEDSSRRNNILIYFSAASNCCNSGISSQRMLQHQLPLLPHKWKMTGPSKMPDKSCSTCSP